MTKPRIAIAAYRRAVDFGPWQGMRACFAPEGYVAGVTAAGGLPFLVPPLGGDDDAGAYLDAVDGLVLTGGEDISPALYGAEPHPETAPPNDIRDESELALLRVALERDVPVLGICRGAQLLNVAYGGDLVQHVEGDAHLASPGAFAHHPVDVTGTRLTDVAPSFPDVSSYHHQSFGRIGEGLAVAGTAPDGLVEALEDGSRDFCIGVLWHPEEDPHVGGLPLFQGLVEAARRFRELARTRETPSR